MLITLKALSSKLLIIGTNQVFNLLLLTKNKEFDLRESWKILEKLPINKEVVFSLVTWNSYKRNSKEGMRKKINMSWESRLVHLHQKPCQKLLKIYALLYLLFYMPNTHVEGIDQNFQITETTGYKIQMNDCCHPEEIVAQFLNSLIKFGPRSALHSTFSWKVII